MHTVVSRLEHGARNGKGWLDWRKDADCGLRKIRPVERPRFFWGVFFLVVDFERLRATETFARTDVEAIWRNPSLTVVSCTFFRMFGARACPWCSSERCWGYANVRIGNLRLTYQVQPFLFERVRPKICNGRKAAIERSNPNRFSEGQTYKG